MTSTAKIKTARTYGVLVGPGRPAPVFTFWRLRGLVLWSVAKKLCGPAMRQMFLS